MTIRLTARRIALSLLVLAMLGFAYAWSGLISISASSGHFAPVGWFLHWTMRNAVRTQSLAVEQPEHRSLDDPDLVRRAAGHFESSCAPCHGAPGSEPGEAFQHMTPRPPNLAEQVHEWRDRELFWIVKYGIKYTGMPAWPAQRRDDEVWAMVAFLRVLPELDAARYGQLSGAELVADADLSVPASDPMKDIVERRLTDCIRCHGRDGAQTESDAFPVIAGLSPEYLNATLRAYATGQRNSGIMESASVDLEPQIREALAEHYARQQRTMDEPNLADRDSVELGKQIAEHGLLPLGVPACEACHGHEATERNDRFPQIHGQGLDYLKTQLTLFKEGRRGGTSYANVMTMVARNLPQRGIEAVALYYQSRSRHSGEAPQSAD